MRRFNVFTPDFTYADARPAGYRAGTARFGPLIGAARMAGTVYELPPGESTWPYHYEYGSEEWLLVLEGTPTLRHADGEDALEPGDLVCFPNGPEGAHKVTNKSEAVARLMIISTYERPAVAIFPDSDKLGVWPDGERDIHMSPRDSNVDYWTARPRRDAGSCSALKRHDRVVSRGVLVRQAEGVRPILAQERSQRSHPLVDAWIAAIAARQHGAITTAQFLRARLDHSSISKRAANGRDCLASLTAAVRMKLWRPLNHGLPRARAAKALGQRGAIAHGMWTKARCLAALEIELAEAYMSTCPSSCRCGSPAARRSRSTAATSRCGPGSRTFSGTVTPGRAP